MGGLPPLLASVIALGQCRQRSKAPVLSETQDPMDVTGRPNISVAREPSKGGGIIDPVGCWNLARDEQMVEGINWQLEDSSLKHLSSCFFAIHQRQSGIEEEPGAAVASEG